ncbi:MAG: hypothetical protein QM715_11520 [Nibricoccus sp.]
MKEQAPQLSFVCPIPWDSMKGAAKARYCETCQRNIPNLSLISRAEREVVLAKLGTEEVCAAFYRRLSGELVTAEELKMAGLKSTFRQLGVGALAATTLGFAAGCTSPKKPEPIPAPQSTTTEAKPQTEPAKDEEIVLLMGIICPPKPPPAPKTIGPPSKTH